MQDHGRIIPLTPEPYEPERHMEVNAGFALEPDETLSAEVSQILAGIRRNSGGRFELRGRTKLLLDGVTAERVIVKYYETKTKKWEIEDLVEALQGGIEYTLYLKTPANSYEHDRAAFDSFVQSFKFSRK